MKNFKTLQDKRAYHAKIAKKHYEALKADPVKWEEYKQKRRAREREAYNKMMEKLKSQE